MSKRILNGIMRGAFVALVVTAGCRVDQLINPGGPNTYPPDEPSTLRQYRSDGLTAIGAGATIDEASVVLAAVVADSEATDTLRLQVEVKAVGTAFTGAPTQTGQPVVSGVTATVAVGGLVQNTAYHWQARVVDRGNRTSEWVEFADGASMSFRVAIPTGPADPIDAAQLQSDGISAIALGSETIETVVVLAASVSDPDEGATVRLEVEVRPIGTPFSGVATGESNAVPSGGRASVSAGVIDETQYHWQYRASDGTGRFSAWRGFGGNNETAPDFIVAIDDIPGEPTASAQLRTDGTTPIPVGGSTPETSVTLAATPIDPDPGDALRLQVELQPLEIPFTGLPTHTSTTVPAATRATITAAVTDDADYHWQYRTIDQTDRAGSWIEFGANGAASDFRVAVPDAPAVPADANQYHGLSAAPIPVGGNTPASPVTLAGTVIDPDIGAAIRFEVEVRETSVAFTGSPTHASTAVSSGSRGSVTIGVSQGANYHWRYRGIDETGRSSEWTSFGGNADGATDFSVSTIITPPPPPPPPPGTPSGLAQFGPDSTTAIPVGGTAVGASVVLAATVEDQAPGAVLTLEIELRLVSEAFSNTATGSAGSLSNGQAGRIAFAASTPGSYHWQARTCRASSCGSWLSFGANAEAAADFVRP